jgi:hypothetical protein
MADYLHISIYSYMAHGASGSGSLQAPQAPALEEWQIPIELESTQSPPFPEGATFIMVRPDTDCCLAFGADPEAVIGQHPVDAKERMWYGVHPGHKIAVIET